MNQRKHSVLGLAIVAGLSMAACTVADRPPVEQTSDHPLYPAARQTTQPTTPATAQAAARLTTRSTALASIRTQQAGKRIWAAGKASLAATNAWLAARGEHFVAANPADMPNPYWRLDPEENAYIFVDVTESGDSRWELDGRVRTGPYGVADLTIYGFATDASGAPRDITGDGVVDDDDWTGLEVSTMLSGTSAADTALLVAFEHGVFGAHAAGGAVSVSGVDPEGYPNRALISDESSAVTIEIGAGNQNRCDPESVEWERCWYFGQIAGSSITIYPVGRSPAKEWRIENNAPNWVKFDASTDTFKARGELGAQLRALDFTPLFWVRSPEFKADFDSRAQLIATEGMLKATGGAIETAAAGPPPPPADDTLTGGAIGPTFVEPPPPPIDDTLTSGGTEPAFTEPPPPDVDDTLTSDLPSMITTTGTPVH